MSVVIFHPLALGISLACALALAARLKGAGAVKYFFGIPFAVMLLCVILNPLFVHKGITVMFFIGESPVTKEALVYGACTAMMLGAVIMWFYCYGIIMTSDRFMAVFGRRAPSASLVFSMVLRFIPRVKRQTAKVAAAQRCLGRRDGRGRMGGSDHVDDSDRRGSKDRVGGSHKHRARDGLRIISVITTWALENSIETADSMRARGYGCGTRSHYTKYEMKASDAVIIVFMIIAAVTVFALAAKGMLAFYCYPEVIIESGWQTAVMAALLTMLYMCPLVIETIEEVRWKRSRSGI